MLRINHYNPQIFSLPKFSEFNVDGKNKNQVILILAFSILFTMVCCTAVLIYKKIYKAKTSSESQKLPAHTILNRSSKHPIIEDVEPIEIQGTLPLVLPSKKEIEDAQLHPQFIQTQVKSNEIEKPPPNASLSSLCEIFERITTFSAFPGYVEKSAITERIPKPTANRIMVVSQDLKWRIKQTIPAIESFSSNWGGIFAASEKRKINLLLLHIADYIDKQSHKIDELNKQIKKLENPLELFESEDARLAEINASKDEILKIEKNIIAILLEDIGLAFEHCNDRKLSDLENIYFTRIAQSASFVENLTFKNKVLLALQIDRRNAFDRAVDICLDKMPDHLKGHFAASYRYYMRLFREEFGLGGIPDQKSVYETNAFVGFGYENQIKEQFKNIYSPQHVLETFREMVRTDKGMNGPYNECYKYLKETYDLSTVDSNEILDEETFQLTPAICLRVLKDFEVLIFSKFKGH